jgi:ribose 5-phosphate isomerase B
MINKSQRFRYNVDMIIYIGSDHGGFELKKKLVEYLQSKNIEVKDVGAYELDPLDGYPDYAAKVASAVADANDADNVRGILACRNGVGMDIVANRFKGVRSALGFDAYQVQKAREDDNVNVLALPADFISFEKAAELVDAFLNAKMKTIEKYHLRLKKIDELSQ